MSWTDRAPGTPVRLAALRELQRLRSERGVLTQADLQAGFLHDGRRVPLLNRARGIWKPAFMRHLLSIKTVHPRPGNRVWNSDQYGARDEVYRADEFVNYPFQGSDPAAFDNQWMRRAMLEDCQSNRRGSTEVQQSPPRAPKVPSPMSRSFALTSASLRS